MCCDMVACSMEVSALCVAQAHVCAWRLQTDWSLSSMRLRIVGDEQSASSVPAISLPMASLEGRPGIAGRLFGAYLPIVPLDPELLQSGIAPPGISCE